MVVKNDNYEMEDKKDYSPPLTLKFSTQTLNR